MSEKQSEESKQNTQTERNTCGPNASDPIFQERETQTPTNVSAEGLINRTYEGTNGQLLMEASKIIQVGIEKDFALTEKDKIIQDTTETVDNLRKNIIQIQLEYEHLDQNYQKEISYRAELLKRIETTRNMIESAAHYSNILATSIKQLEDDKFKIAEFYNVIYQRQEDAEVKRKKVESIVQEQDELIKKGVSRGILSEEISVLKNKLMHCESQLKKETEEKNKLEAQVDKFINDIHSMKSVLQEEKTIRTKYQIIQSRLKRTIMRVKADHEKALTIRRILYKKKVKNYVSKIGDLERSLNVFKEAASSSSFLNNELQEKLKNMEKHFHEMDENHRGNVMALKANLHTCLNEKEDLTSQLNSLKKEADEEKLKNSALAESHDNLMKKFEIQELEVLEREKAHQKILKENFDLKEKLEETLIEIQRKTQIIKDLEDNMHHQDLEKMRKKIESLENEIVRHCEVEKEQNGYIEYLKKSIEIDSSHKVKTISHQEARLKELENSIENLMDQKQLIEEKLQKIESEYREARNELITKSCAIEKLSNKLESEMKMMSNNEEILSNLKGKLAEQTLTNKELIQRIQKFEVDKMELERALKKDLESEKALNKALRLEKNESEMSIQKLMEELENKIQLLECKTQELEGAKTEISELNKKSERAAESKETILKFKKSLESAEANVEAYKIIIKKLENEADERRKSDNEVITSLKQEIIRLKQMNQKNDDFNKILSSPKEMDTSRGREIIISPVTDGKSSISTTETPKSGRRLLMTPRRLLADSYPPQKFKSVASIVKPRDPYDYESDNSVENLNIDKRSLDYKKMREKDNLTKRKRK